MDENILSEKLTAMKQIEESLWETVLHDVDFTADPLSETLRIQNQFKDLFGSLIIVRMKMKYLDETPRPDFYPTDNL